MASRCPSTTTTWFGSPPLDSAMTFQSKRFGSTIWWMLRPMTGGVPAEYSLKRLWPIANDVNATGMLATNGLPAASTMLPLNTEVRSGVLPSLKMTTPAACAASALSTFTPKLHVPRWISAILPANELSKSPGSQPLLEPPVGGMSVWPAGLTWALLASPWLAPGFQSLTSVKLRAVGETSLKLGVPMYDEYVNVYGWMLTS